MDDSGFARPRDRCEALSALCAHLLETYSMLCLSLLKDRSGLERFYTRIGFRYHGDDGDYAVVRY